MSPPSLAPLPRTASLATRRTTHTPRGGAAVRGASPLPASVAACCCADPRGSDRHVVTRACWNTLENKKQSFVPSLEPRSHALCREIIFMTCFTAIVPMGAGDVPGRKIYGSFSFLLSLLPLTLLLPARLNFLRGGKYLILRKAIL
eukprot:766515-Hanusia_phi.AAC.3